CGGPGAPAFLHVAERHHQTARSPLWGWLGHRDPFAFESDYSPAEGPRRFLCGTPPILSMAALDAALDLWRGDVDLERVRAKSVALGDALIRCVRERCPALELVSPPGGARRGSQVTFRHPRGYALVQALIARGVIGDFRAPDLMRFGLHPLTLRYVDAWDAVSALAEVLESGEYLEPRFERRQTVT
ncbi:MAG: kynureninase, partial [Acidobacteriota bacterium]